MLFLGKTFLWTSNVYSKADYLFWHRYLLFAVAGKSQFVLPFYFDWKPG